MKTPNPTLTRAAGRSLLLALIFCALGCAETAKAYYDPGAQRWINRDPVAESGSAQLRRQEIAGRSGLLVRLAGWSVLRNLYSLVVNQPLEDVDPWGLVPKPGDIKWCSKALKALKEYERLAGKFGVCLPQSRLDKLNALRDAGKITSNDLPATLRKDFPSCFEGMTLEEIEDFCP
jgi:hypothetical protein